MILAAVFPKIQKVDKKGFFARNDLFLWFLRLQNRGGVCLPELCPKISKTLKFGLFFGVFVPALGWSCRTVLHTSVPAYRGFSTEIPIFFEFSGPKIGMGGSSHRSFLPNHQKPWNLAYFGVFLSALGW